MREVGRLFKEIDALSSQPRDPLELLDVRAANAFSASMKVIDYIDATFDEETATDLKKSFLNSVKSGDWQKFQRAMKRARKRD